MIKNYFLISLRNLVRKKFFVLLNIFGMGLGIACCITAFLNWKFNEDWDSIHKNINTIYRVQFWDEFNGGINRYGLSPVPLAGLIKQNFKDVDKVIRFMPVRSVFRIDDEVFATGIGYADVDFFKVFTFELRHGSFEDFGDRKKIFISDELAQKYFGKEDVVGELLIQIIDNQTYEYSVGGVFRKPPVNSSFYSEAYTAWDNYWNTVKKGQNKTIEELDENNWNLNVILFLQIVDPSRIEPVTAGLQKYVGLQNEVNGDFKVKGFYLENLKGMAERNRQNPRVLVDNLRIGLPKEAVIVPNIMAVLLLLLACFNFTNTSIAVSSQRLKEIGLRKVLGGLRRQLIFQFLAENLLLCFLGLVVGILLAEILVPAYDSLWSWLELDFTYRDNYQIIVFLFFLLLFTALVAGGYPAFYITSFEPVSILKGKMKFAGTNWFTRTLLGLQFFISLLSLIFAVAFYRNGEFQKTFDLGFSTNNVVSAFIESETEFNIYRDALMTNQDVKIVSGVKDHIIGSFDNGNAEYEAKEKIRTDIIHVDNNYLNTMGIQIVEGRNFVQDSQTDKAESILVTEEFVRKFGWTDSAIGKRVILNDRSFFVIGVVKNIYARALWRPLEPLAICYANPSEYKQIIVSTSPNKMKSLNDFMEAKWKVLFPNSVYNGRRIDVVMAETIEANNNIIKVFSFLGFFAVVFSVTGLYALASLNIMKNTKQIGIRKVLGASISNIVYIINLEFAVVLLAAVILGVSAGFYMTDKIMDSIWDYYKQLDVVGILASVSVIILSTIITVGFKTYAAASMDPVKTLRHE
jgi:putative ABC transport system permease protein